MKKTKQYFLKQNRIVEDEGYSIVFKKGYYDALIINEEIIKVFHHTGWWVFPIEWFNLNKIKGA